jgi:hypothetical protein
MKTAPAYCGRSSSGSLAAEHAEKYVFQRHTETDRDSFRPVVAEEPFMTGLEQQGHGNLPLFVASSGRVERALPLPHEDLYAFFHIEDRKHFAVQLKSERIGNRARNRSRVRHCCVKHASLFLYFTLLFRIAPENERRDF